MVKDTQNNPFYFIISFSKEKKYTEVTAKNRRPNTRENHCMVRWHLNGLLSREMFSSLSWPKKRVSRRLIFIEIWNNKILTSLLGEIMVPPCFALGPRVFHWDPLFSTWPRVFHQTPSFPPPDPVFSTPHVFHQTPCFPHPGTPYPGTPAPRFPPSL